MIPSDFIQLNLEELSFQASASWLKRGWRHGFTGANADFSSLGLREWAPKFLRTFGINGLWLLRQAHGDQIIDLDNINLANREPLKPISATNFEVELALVGDALIGHTQESQPVAIGVRTADCVPVIVRCEAYYAVIHAGWRGLAAGIISKTLAQLGQKGNSRSFYVLIGPCAGPESYEVGVEVIESIGERAVYRQSANGRFLLDLVSTAQNEIEPYEPVSIIANGACTITDKSYHSYRRASSPSASNLSFAIL